MTEAGGVARAGLLSDIPAGATIARLQAERLAAANRTRNMRIIRAFSSSVAG